MRFGGVGTPVVAEFAADAWAPILAVAPLTAGHLLGDALDLWHRLPWVRTGLREGTVSLAAARTVAAGARELSLPRLDRAQARRARACQLDHTVPWPHGPTCPCNLGPLCTRHHRLKTHTGWRLAQPWPGTFLWRSPTGAHYLVDASGTTEIDRCRSSTDWIADATT